MLIDVCVSSEEKDSPDFGPRWCRPWVSWKKNDEQISSISLEIRSFCEQDRMDLSVVLSYPPSDSDSGEVSSADSGDGPLSDSLPISSLPSPAPCTEVISISEPTSGKELSSCSVSGCRSAYHGSWGESVSGRTVPDSLCTFFNPRLGVEWGSVAQPGWTAIVRGASEERMLS